MEKIRVTRGIEVEVNDAGDTIIINVEDTQFIERFYGLIDKLQGLSTKFEAEKAKGTDERTQAKQLLDSTRELMVDIDTLFGENCCRKVFGDIVPGPYLIADFFNQLTPIAQRYSQNRQKEIAGKYNVGRKGAGNIKPYRKKRRHS
ncbi:MAG: hypothetical protein J1E83_12640 [Lachnospiraceae bacterium]|nr:hypothetical protein [Lachnospiraceae bacterium]